MLLAEYNRDPWDVDRAKITLEELFQLWKDKKAPKLGQSNRASLYSAFKHCSKLVNHPYKQIKAFQMQETIDGCGKGYSTQAAIKNLWGHLDRFALELDVITRCYSELLELKKSDVDLQAGTMKGGTKTKAGKNRLVPIHSLIRPMVERRMNEPGEYLIQWNGGHCSQSQYRLIWKGLTDRLQLPGTPHSCRHTLESLLDSAGANRKCIDLLMGHVSKDTGNRVYNHKTLDELKTALEMVQRKPL